VSSSAAASATGFELVRLERDECERLLAQASLGRVAVNLAGSAPVIRPVNYVFDKPSQSVAFRCASGSKLHALAHADRAAFEVDGEDDRGTSGWSMIIVGPVEPVTAASDLARLGSAPLRGWFDGADAPHWLRIHASAISGRRISSRGAPPPSSSPR